MIQWFGEACNANPLQYLVEGLSKVAVSLSVLLVDIRIRRALHAWRHQLEKRV